MKVMSEIKNVSRLQTVALIALRVLIGWQILFEGISKLMDPSWSSFGFLNESKWILSGLSHWIISNKDALNWVDFLNTWGLIAIGLGLILGLFCRIAAISGAFLLFVYYLNNPPFIGLEYSIPSEGNYLIVNKTLIESTALIVIAVFSSQLDFGLESLYRNFRMKRNPGEEEAPYYSDAK
jgi:thiosulfate dehydrogenase [quinone] large subunit